MMVGLGIGCPEGFPISSQQLVAKHLHADGLQTWAARLPLVKSFIAETRTSLKTLTYLHRL